MPADTQNSYTSLHATSSLPGHDAQGQAKPNQNAVAVDTNLSNLAITLLGVFDGHGPMGAGVAKAVAGLLPPAVAREAALLKADRYAAAMDRAFPRCNRAITRVRGLDTQLSGCTSCVALLTPQGQLVVANLGDSRCLLGKVEPCGQGVTAWEFTNDHTPASPAEAARVQACGGCVAKYSVHGQAVGPLRVWCKDRDAPGLCITRSFGDALAHSIGVTEEPEVVTHSLEKSDRYLLIVTNSICEYMENQEVMEYVHAQASQGLAPEAVGKSLCQEAQRRWRQHEQGLAAECTVVVVYLHQQSAEVCDSRATVSCMPSLRRK
ncbi:phosphatase 2C-like domain-containing protein [Haematococcus lacustris]